MFSSKRIILSDGILLFNLFKTFNEVYLNYLNHYKKYNVKFKICYDEFLIFIYSLTIFDTL